MQIDVRTTGGRAAVDVHSVDVHAIDVHAIDVRADDVHADGDAGEKRQVLRLVGRLDVQSVADLRLALHAAIDAGAGALLLDVSQLEVADATGLGVLVGAHRRAGRAGRSVVLRGVQPRLQRLLAATRLHRILAVEPLPAYAGS